LKELNSLLEGEKRRPEEKDAYARELRGDEREGMGRGGIHKP